jgi:hypothetical protein
MYDIFQTVPAAFCSFLDGLSSGARLFKDLDMTTANLPSSTADDRFSEVLALIHNARHKALQAVLPDAICFVCASFTRLIVATKKCQHC